MAATILYQATAAYSGGIITAKGVDHILQGLALLKRAKAKAAEDSIGGVTANLEGVGSNFGCPANGGATFLTNLTAVIDDIETGALGYLATLDIGLTA